MGTALIAKIIVSFLPTLVPDAEIAIPPPASFNMNNFTVPSLVSNASPAPAALSMYAVNITGPESVNGAISAVAISTLKSPLSLIKRPFSNG
uniref:Uncharacterized protein n=1 Tax=Uncultured archaeon GZfos26G2 TaxID=3386331 RepID=A0A830YKG0_UNCAG|nr:hypothetical protein GZ26G2_51 [uncultured archaeon GZfos26G2]